MRVATHHADQVVYFDVDGLQRRMDCVVDFNGVADVAHYTDAHKSFDGVAGPRPAGGCRVCRRLPDSTADRTVAAITVDLDDIVID